VRAELTKLGRLGRNERLTLGAICVTVLLWVFGRQLGIDAASVAVAALIFLLASGVVSRDAFQTKVSWPALIFIGVTLNLAEVLPYLGVDAWLGQRLLPVFAPLVGRPVLFFTVLMLVVAVVRQFLISDFAVITIMMLILSPVASAAGINPWTIGIAAHLIVQVIWILPFQNDAYLISHQAAGNRLADQRKAAVLSVLSIAIAMVAVLASLPWWRSLGMI
jgi:di/tricarboxylate transporter